MSNLSEALSRHYSRKNHKVVFANGWTMNRLAINMWEQLGFQQVDVSVISRVIKGERLFTAAQLEAFCVSLQLSNDEVEYLRLCLRSDYNERLGMIGIPSQASVLHELAKDLTTDMVRVFYRGEYEALDKKRELLDRLIIMQSPRMTDKQYIEPIGTSMYLQARALSNGEVSSRVVSRILPAHKRLLDLAQIDKNAPLFGRAYVLLSNAYYLAGGYSLAVNKRRFYKRSITAAKTAIDSLPIADHESVFALRTMAASAYYIDDRETLDYVHKYTKQIIPEQPLENHANTLLLARTLDKYLSRKHGDVVTATQDMTRQYLGETPINAGVYELSNIKEEIDTLRVFERPDEKQIKLLASDAFTIAKQYNFSRQKRYYSNLLRQL